MTTVALPEHLHTITVAGTDLVYRVVNHPSGATVLANGRAIARYRAMEGGVVAFEDLDEPRCNDTLAHVGGGPLAEAIAYANYLAEEAALALDERYF